MSSQYKAGQAAGGQATVSGLPQAEPDFEQAGYEQAGHGSGEGAAWGFTMLAAVLLVLGGIWAFLTGLSALLKGGFFVATPNYYYNINVTGWGWIHVALGALLFVTGCCLFARQAWARVVGVFLAVISAVMNFLFIPRYPFWAITMIVLDAVIIWALSTVDRRRAW